MPGKNNIKMRKFKLSDLDTVRDLIHNTIDISYSKVYNTEAIKYFKDYHNDKNILKDAKEGYIIVLESNNQIIGTGTIINDYITRVFVNPEFQKHGFGKLLMEKLETKALSAGISVVKLDSSLPAKRFYDSLGYETIEKTFVEVGNGKKLDYYKMEKSLKSNRLPTMLKIFSAETNKDIKTVKQLFVEYADSLGFDLCFQNFDEELANLPGDYAPPSGCLLLARYNGEAAGCIALRKLSDCISEMKRLYVKPQMRGLKIGRKLVEAVIAEARKIGYTHIRADTVPSMKQARALYTSIGFKEIKPYCRNPIEGAIFIELKL